MRRNAMSGALLVLALAALAPLALAQKAPKIKDTVTFAQSWDEAVEEAKILNVPIVVHSHGFYWGPCWGMHSAVLQNKKYIKFAEDNTVEVLSLSRLDEGIQKEDPKAAKYKAKDAAGNEVEYMVSWPNLTLEMITDLNRSKAGTYNKTGKIPYTSIVNPHTQEELAQLPGGRSAKQLQEAVEEAAKQLQAEHGKGLAREELKRTDMAIEKAREEVADGDYDGAIKLLDKAGHGDQKTHEFIAAKLQTMHDEIIAGAKERFEEIKAMEPKEKKRELNRFISKNKKTGLEDEIRAEIIAMKEDK